GPDGGLGQRLHRANAQRRDLQRVPVGVWARGGAWLAAGGEARAGGGGAARAVRRRGARHGDGGGRGVRADPRGLPVRRERPAGGRISTGARGDGGEAAAGRGEAVLRRRQHVLVEGGGAGDHARPARRRG